MLYVLTIAGHHQAQIIKKEGNQIPWTGASETGLFLTTSSATITPLNKNQTETT